jgi:hypothetical protein
MTIRLRMADILTKGMQAVSLVTVQSLPPRRKEPQEPVKVLRVFFAGFAPSR